MDNFIEIRLSDRRKIATQLGCIELMAESTERNRAHIYLLRANTESVRFEITDTEYDRLFDLLQAVNKSESESAQRVQE